MPLIDILAQFRASITQAESFIDVAFQTDNAGNYLQQQNVREFITDSAYLKMFIAWETFLESLFIQYLIGELSISGNIVQRFVQPIDSEHASRMLIGTQKYVDWSNPDIIVKLNNIFFEHTNIIAQNINSTKQDLFDLKTIRNAAAHLTATTSGPLDSLGSRKLRRQCHNLKVSDLILAIDPESLINETILKTYLNKLDIIAELMANG